MFPSTSHIFYILSVFEELTDLLQNRTDFSQEFGFFLFLNVNKKNDYFP